MSTDTHQHYGRARHASRLQDYESPEEYAEQGDERVVKVLQFAYHVLEPSPMLVGQEIVSERTAVRNQVVYTDELGPMYLERGERLGAFYTTAELKTLGQSDIKAIVDQLPEDEEAPDALGEEGDGKPDNFSEWGAHEMAEYLEEHKPNVNETIALAGNDPAAANRLLEAENIVTDNDPRTGVVKGLTAIIQNGGQ